MSVATATLLLLQCCRRRDRDSTSARKRSVRHASHSQVGGVERQVVVVSEADTAHTAVRSKAASLRAASTLSDPECLAEALLLRVRLLLRSRGRLRCLAGRNGLERRLRRDRTRRTASLRDLNVAVPTESETAESATVVSRLVPKSSSHGTTSPATARSRVEAARRQALSRQDGRTSEWSVTEVGVTLANTAVRLCSRSLRRRRAGTRRVLQVTQVEDGPVRNSRTAVVGAATRHSSVRSRHPRISAP